MVLKFSVLFLSFVFWQSGADAQLRDYVDNLVRVGQTLTINHQANRGSSRYLVTSPADSYIEVSCKLSTTCGRHIFSVSRAGEKDLSDASTYCGGGTTPFIRSIGNEMVVALDNGSAAPGTFSCTFTVIAQTASNCDCGWSVNTKIVGGGRTGVNEIVSHAGLVDVNSKEIYCGATISEIKKLFRKNFTDIFMHQKSPNFGVFLLHIVSMPTLQPHELDFWLVIGTQRLEPTQSGQKFTPSLLS